MGNISREMGIPGKSENEMLKIKNTVTEVKNALWVHRLHTAEQSQ